MKIPRFTCLLGAILSLCCPVHAGAGDSMFRGDPAHTGLYPGQPPQKLTVRWTFQASEAILSSPTVCGGAVYFGSSDNFLYSVDAGTGKLKWKFDAHGNVGSSPAVSDGTVYFVSLDGNLYAVGAESGHMKWSFATLGERRHSAPGIDYAAPSTEMMPEVWDLFLSSPAVVADIVYFGSGDGHVYAVDAATGKVHWKFKTGNVVHASPAVVGGMVYVGSFDTYLYALDAATGEVAWKFKTGDDAQANLMTGIAGSATVADGLVIFGCRDGNIYALDARTGAQRWRFSANGSWVVATPTVLGGVVYFTTSDSLRFEALDERTGAEVYSLPYGTYSFSSPSIAGKRAYFGTFDGKLHAVDLGARRYVGEFAVPGASLNGPRFLDESGKLRGDVVWTGDTMDDTIVNLRSKVFSLGSILSSPAIARGVVYFGSVDGTLYALGDSIP
jgi:outer membrane protein assembly factor BamB